MIQVLIPTYMREDNQKCYNKLPEAIKPLVTLVTHSGRAEELRKQNPGAKVMDMGMCDGIADVRQTLISQMTTGSKVLIIDDGCTFKKRVNMKLVDMDEEDFLAMFADVEAMLDEYPMVGISDQAGNNRVTEDWKEVGRAYSCYGVNVKFLAEHDITFDGMYRKNSEIKLYEDFYLILSLLTKGHKNAILYKYAFNHPHGKKGGNSTVRTNALQKQCLLALQDEFPGLVELVKKEDPSWKAGLDDTENFRWEARIAWQEAYKRGLAGPVADLSSFFG